MSPVLGIWVLGPGKKNLRIILKSLSNTLDLGILGESKHLTYIRSQVGTLPISPNCVIVYQLGFTINNKVSESWVEDLKKVIINFCIIESAQDRALR